MADLVFDAPAFSGNLGGGRDSFRLAAAHTRTARGDSPRDPALARYAAILPDGALPCPYLAGKEERKVFTHLVGERAAELNNILTQGGFRRSQSIAYRPACEGCRSCVSVRVIAREFRPTRSMRRIANRNADIESEMRIAVPTSEQYAIFRAYLNSRHRDGGMADMTVLDYAMMVEDSHIETRIIEYRRREPRAHPRKRQTAARAAAAAATSSPSR